VEEKAADKARLLTALVNVCGVPYAHWKTHPIYLALKRDGITHFFQLGRECVLLFFLYYFSVPALRNSYTR